MSLRLKLAILLSALFLSSIANIVFTFVMEAYEEEKLEWVIHTHEVIHNSEKLLRAMTDAETGQRGFILTGNSDYLEPYHKGITSAEDQFRELLRLTSDNASQQKHLANIKKLMNQKFDELKLTIDLKQKNNAKNLEQMMNIVNKNSGKTYMDDLRAELTTFNNEEKILLAKREGEFRESRAYITTIIGFELIFFVSLGVLTAFFIKNKLFVPLQMLIESTSKMEKGEKQNVEDILPNDEMGYLLSRFYRMSEKVYSRTESLTYQATHDALTGLKNRLQMDKKIDDSITALSGTDNKLAIFFIDVNKFKQLNDTYGHEAGDAILVETANRLRAIVRSSDIAFRQGGDEFVLVIKSITQVSQAETIATNIVKQFSTPFIVNNKPIELSISIGIAISPDDSANSEEILKFSDIAMYAAKRDENSHYSFFDKTMLKRESDT